MGKSWKDSLLRSGLPFENDVRRYLESKGCISSFEFSYLKPDEYRIERQFSYDLDAAYFKGGHFITLMVECKFRHQSVQWVFVPSEYGGPDEFDPNAFMHPFDHFIAPKFPFKGSFPRRLAPCCEKGIELTTDGPNEKAITQAVTQLAFAFSQQLSEAIVSQVRQLLGKRSPIFHHIPIIVTTADLFRLKEGSTVAAIQAASDLEDVCTREHCIVLKYSRGAELLDYNRKVLSAARAELGDAVLKKSIQTFTEDLDHFFEVLANHYCPSAIVVVSVGNGWNAFDKLFGYIDDLVEPPKSLLDEIKLEHARMKAMFAQMEQSLQKRNQK